MASLNTRINQLEQNMEERVKQLEEQMAAFVIHKALQPDENQDKPPVKPAKQPKKQAKQQTKDFPAKEDQEDEVPKKKKTSGYILFSSANREEVKETLQAKNPDEKLKNTEIMKELARLWKELPQDEKDIWNQKAKEN